MAERDGPAVDDGFVPFEPRRRRASLVEVEMIDTQADTAPPARDDDRAIADASSADTILTEDPSSVPTVEEQIIAPVVELDPHAPGSQPPTPVTTCPCDHRLNIRREAIRLAAIACGRALRHAALLHPQTIAGFVDDAITAAGNPLHARIHLHPEAIVEQYDADHERIGDADLGYEDVVVECEGTRLSADLRSRATLLARAAAEQ